MVHLPPALEHTTDPRADRKMRVCRGSGRVSRMGRVNGQPIGFVDLALHWEPENTVGIYLSRITFSR